MVASGDGTGLAMSSSVGVGVGLGMAMGLGGGDNPPTDEVGLDLGLDLGAAESMSGVPSSPLPPRAPNNARMAASPQTSGMGGGFMLGLSALGAAGGGQGAAGGGGIALGGAPPSPFLSATSPQPMALPPPLHSMREAKGGPASPRLGAMGYVCAP
jgi:hypothetical protein